MPKHTELFAEDYYDEQTNKSTKGENPYHGKFPGGGDDFESYNKGTSRSTASGILANYKKQINLSPQDLIQKDYWDKFEKLTSDTSRRLKETRPEVFTKEFTMRLRLQRDLNVPFEKEGHEYGNYEQYEKNSVEEKQDEGFDDDGEAKFFKNY